MNLTISKNICTALCACIISLSCTHSLSARASTNTSLFEKNEEIKTLNDSLLALQTDAQASKDVQAKRFLLNIHAAASKINSNCKKEDVKNALSLLDEGISKFSSSTNNPAYATTSKILTNLKRNVAKTHAQAISAKSAKKHHSHHSHGSHDSHCKSGCSKVIPIDSVPVTITMPGKYCVTKDLLYTGSGDAITIVANNVTINFENHDLILTNPNAIGISATDVSELTILNDKISIANTPASVFSRAIFLNNVTKGLIDNVFTENTFIGVLIAGSTDITLSNSHHKNHVNDEGGYGVFVGDSTAVTIDNCTIEGNSGPTTPVETDGVAFIRSKECRLTNSKILESDLGVLVGVMDGLLIDNCFVSSSPDTYYNAIQLGIFAESVEAHNVIIRNSTILNEYGGLGVDGIYLLNGSGCLIENVLVDTITPEDESGYLPAGIHVGVLEGVPFNDVIIRNSIVQTSSSSANGNQNSFCMLLDYTTNTLIEGCEVSGAVHANIMLSNFDYTQASQCTVRNCVSSNSDVAGIELAPNATANAIINNVVYNNRDYGIFVGEGALYNHLEGNKVFANSGFGITNNEPTTEAYGNTSCNNLGVNCNSVPTPLFQQQTPGASPVVVGSNICCFQN